MQVPPFLYDFGYNYATVPTLIGTPPQQVNITIDISADLLAAYALDCVLCSGTQFFNPAISSTFQSLNYSWDESEPTFSGTEVTDTLGLGGIFEIPHRQFVLINNGANPIATSRLLGGHFGAYLNPFNSTAASEHIFTQLYESGKLLNPVIGMRFDPANPKITIGALDPNDYEGTINWVQIQPDQTADDYNTIPVDGLKGYNGSFFPIGVTSTNLTATLDSLFMGIAIPNTMPYLMDEGYTGPVDTIDIEPELNLNAYICNTTTPYVALTATINGVDYQMDSPNNLLRPEGQSAVGFCNIGLNNRSDTNLPQITLGQPFLRSVYVAYRFPTGNCPGYYGFAFPSGANRTHAQISQTPTSTPTNSAQCLSLTAPTSTPSASVVTAQQMMVSSEKYDVYGRHQDGQVPLMGINDLPKSLWNMTELD
ncbi:aspartic peptidase domain-containing protein [Phlebopus sp. FC_14]|nr:aspartic peptidase domain-containing protein [Phlebopus sp. FC_14]